MLIHIHDHLHVRDLKDRFEKCFPFLKLEFYSKAPSGNFHDEEFLINDAQSIGDIRRSHLCGDLQIKSWNSVAEVEKEFRDKFDLHVQIFRKGKSDWIPTYKTAQNNLRQHSEMSEHLLSTIPAPKQKFDEYEFL